MANSKDQPNIELQEQGEAILSLLTNFCELCDSYEDCQECLYCAFEENEEPDFNPLRCFSYFIAEAFEIDLKKHFDRKETELKGNC